MNRRALLKALCASAPAAVVAALVGPRQVGGPQWVSFTADGAFTVTMPGSAPHGSLYFRSDTPAVVYRCQRGAWESVPLVDAEEVP